MLTVVATGENLAALTTLDLEQVFTHVDAVGNLCYVIAFLFGNLFLITIFRAFDLISGRA